MCEVVSCPFFFVGGPFYFYPGGTCSYLRVPTRQLSNMYVVSYICVNSPLVLTSAQTPPHYEKNSYVRPCCFLPLTEVCISSCERRGER